MSAPETTVSALEEIHAEIRTCTRCALGRTRTNPVPGEGNPRARVMFVGEGPGAEEDATGRPFVGAAGRLLNRLLPLAGLERETVFIANLVKCRPPGNRTPLPEEIAACRPFLIAQIATIQPDLICTLGSPALKELVSPRYSISQVHGRLFKIHGLLHYALFHPAAALYDESRLQTMQSDMRRIRPILQRLDPEEGGVVAAGNAAVSPSTGQNDNEPADGVCESNLFRR